MKHHSHSGKLSATQRFSLHAGVFLAGLMLVGTAFAGPPGAGDIFAINAGGASAAKYKADSNFVLGRTYGSDGRMVFTMGVPNAAPSFVYQTEREGENFSYVFPGLTPNTTYLVRLHFAELYFSAPGKRQFNVDINGMPVLTDFDIVQTAGDSFRANVQQFFIKSDASGNIKIDFSRGAVDQPSVNAIEIRNVGG